jgi:hypothetical protein
MGFRAAGLMIEGQPLDGVLAALPGSPRPSGAPVLGDEALSMALDADFAVAEVGRWTVVSDPGLRATWSSDVHESLSQGSGRVLGFLIDDLTTTHGFVWHAAGRTVRSAFYVEGEPADQAGDPLPEEEGLPDPSSEDFVPTLAHRLTGLGFGALLAASYTLLRSDDR